MPPCNHQRRLGPRRAGGSVAAPWAGPLTTALLWWAAGWAWDASLVVLGLGLACRWDFSFYPFTHFLLYAFYNCAFCFIFHLYSIYLSCKTLNLQYMWKYVNSKCICVKSLFISPILYINWRSDLVAKDRQQPTLPLSSGLVHSA
jgi:hypothetical protein